MSYYSLLSWGVTVFLIGAAISIYRPDLLGQGGAAKKAQEAKDIVSKNVPKKVKNNKQVQQAKTTVDAAIDVAQSTAQSLAKDGRPSKKRKPNGATSAAKGSVAEGSDRKSTVAEADDNNSDKEFAQQLAQARAGTTLQSGSQRAAGTTGRLSLAAPAPDEQLSTTTSSTTGQDADDDSSSLDAPIQSKSSGRDVSDMLEKPHAAPSALRITSIPEEKKAAVKPPPFEQVESKKQRQARLKREEQKRMMEESNKMHEAKKQEQLRTARMAAGTSNQTKANNFAATSQNVWQNKPDDVTDAPARQVQAPLLDTFTPPTPQSESVTTRALSDITGQEVDANSANVAREMMGEHKTSARAASKREGVVAPSWSDQVSEEEQMQRIRDAAANDAWESVTNKKGKKKGKTDTETGSEASFTQGTTPVSFSQQTVMPPASTSATGMRGAGKTSEGSSTVDKSNRFVNLPTTNPTGLEDDEWGA